MITYAPFDGFVGTDSFEYEVSDVNDYTSTAVVTIDVLDAGSDKHLWRGH
jgi:hypothetical protein